MNSGRCADRVDLVHTEEGAAFIDFSLFAIITMIIVLIRNNASLSLSMLAVSMKSDSCIYVSHTHTATYLAYYLPCLTC